ncbi:zinc ABC transporter ATP-binding protein AztA [Microbacterium sp. M3]|uniref:Zinc ABC transporter ATP-binding protein AztA n=1 Tax=Microbacterium arthrosphaerae TaxID=792652 RepID=A0ABU4H2J7_9MICO|nr:MULTISPECIES: zinc ABC transporter ATP-binding protein AztA [Microbacterium]MDW4573553.1 zinc ABC transporter ATP-binding protein AztA [Microbacterium arthrosphaerae]MDW7607408.1 zinc ABC transporter ATP-binding protein AztA [Microbacterium sp. M3]
MTPALPPPARLALRAIRVDFGGAEVLRGIDADVAPASLTVIAGPNGAGKSTLLEVMAGTLTPSAGRVEVAGATRAFVPQRSAVTEHLPVTVRDVVTVGAWGRIGPWRALGRTARRAVDDALEAVDLVHLQRARFHTLSGGQRQRALLAQGLARGADLLLLDEPTTALDAESAGRILATMRTEADRGAAVVCVSHDRAVIDAADALMAIDDGRLVEPAMA